MWYDTLLSDWVVRLPVSEAGDAALLPLEIGWFDMPLPAVYRTAGDLVYGGDELEEIVSQECTDARRSAQADAGRSDRAQVGRAQRRRATRGERPRADRDGKTDSSP